MPNLPSQSRGRDSRPRKSSSRAAHPARPARLIKDLRARLVLLTMIGLVAAGVAMITPGEETSRDNPPQGGGAPTPGADSSGPGLPATGGTDGASLVASEPTAPVVASVPLRGSNTVRGRQVAGRGSAMMTQEAVTSTPQDVDGYATIGVTWAASEARGSATVSARSRDGEGWSPWVELDADAEHAPDADSAEASGVRSGTEAYVVGEVEQVQVKVSSAGGGLPEDLTLALVDPGADQALVEQPPEILAEESSSRPESAPAGGASTNAEGSRVAAVTASASRSGAVPSRPAIYSRDQWGADERIRSRSSLRYGRVSVGFVHHTVNANTYTRAQVPSLIRGIYAYHVKSRGWSDVGYNFIVDRFGRIWEGRYGGVGRAVVGAHTLGYNERAFAMSALGNFDIAAPSKAMIGAYQRLFAWKLSRHGIRADSSRSVLGKKFSAISGHRDAGSTACPGRFLYARLGDIRRGAAAAQGSFAPRQAATALGDVASPTILVRNAETQLGWIWRISKDGSSPRVRKVPTGIDLAGVRSLNTVGDWDGDGYGDFLARRRSDGTFLFFAGRKKSGRFANDFAKPKPFQFNAKRYRGYTPAGDVTGDGKPDLVARSGAGQVVVIPSKGAGGFAKPYSLGSKAANLVGVGLWNAEGAPDFVRLNESRVVLKAGNGPGFLGKARSLGSLPGFSRLRSVGDIAGSKQRDLVVRKSGTDDLYVVAGERRSLGRPRFFIRAFDRVDLMS